MNLTFSYKRPRFQHAIQTITFHWLKTNQPSYFETYKVNQEILQNCPPQVQKAPHTFEYDKCDLIDKYPIFIGYT